MILMLSLYLHNLQHLEHYATNLREHYLPDPKKFCSKIVDYLVEKENAFIKKVWNRDIMRRCGAPVGYKASLARKIIEKLDTSEIKKFKSDLEMILYLFPDTKIFIYESTEFNFKITFREDLKIAEKLL